MWVDKPIGDGAGGSGMLGSASVLVLPGDVSPASVPELIAEVEAARAYRG